MYTILKRLLPTTAALVTSLALANPSSLLGHWHGIGESTSERRFIVPCIDEIVPSDANRFRATFTLDENEIIPCIFPVDATLSNEGVITGIGTDSHGHRLLIHGKTRLLGDGSVRVAAFKFKAYEWHGGLMDEGHAALVQMIGGTAWNETEGAHVDSSFFGQYDDGQGRTGAAMESTLMNVVDRAAGTATTMIKGELTFNQVDWINPPEPVLPGLYDFTFELGGTVGLPAVQLDGSSIASFAALGWADPPDPVAPNGIIAVLVGQVVHPPSDPAAIIPCIIPGDYRLYDSFQKLYDDVFLGTDTSFSQGSFLLTEQTS